jgi:uncharacterized protein YdhG (YjbR/CyaY superfamily)
MNATFPTTIDEYIARFPPDIQAVLQQVRATIQAAAPEATEKISYQMPTFFLHGNLVHFAAFKKHLGFYPTPTGIDQFKAELATYTNAKGSVQFPFDRPIPYDIIARITAFRVEENLAKAAAGPKKKLTR